MLKVSVLSFIVSLLFIGGLSYLYGDNALSIIEKMYAREVRNRDFLKGNRYEYTESIEIVKMNTERDVTAKYLRKYRVVSSYGEESRDLIIAENFEDGEWKDVSTDERKKSQTKDKNSKRRNFDIIELFSPDKRKLYSYSLVCEESLPTGIAYKIHIDTSEKENEFYVGDVWVNKREMALVKAILKATSTPVGIKYVNLYYRAERYTGVKGFSHLRDDSVGSSGKGKLVNLWLPAELTFESRVKVIFIFSGFMRLTIRYHDYRIN